MRDGSAGRPVHHLWRTAPLRLLRHPPLFAAIAVGCLLLVVAAAAYPLFISATESRLVRSQLRMPTMTRFGAGLVYQRDSLGFRERVPGGDEEALLHERMDELFAELVAASPALDEPLVQVVGGLATLASTDRPEETRTGRLFSGEGALDHVEIVEGRDGPGVWISDLVAEPLGLHTGDLVRLRGRAERTVDLEVDGVYRSLYNRPIPGYWLLSRENLIGECPDCPPPPQFLILDLEQMIEVSRAIGERDATFAWQAPIADPYGLTLAAARELDRFEATLRARISDDRTEVGRTFGCCGALGFFQDRTILRSGVDSVIVSVEQRVAALQSPGLVLQVAGVVVALLVVGFAGIFALAAREVEAGLLFARGAAPLSVGAKGALETILPALTGAAAGLGVAFALVVALGPDGAIAAGAIADAVRAAGLATLVAVLLLGLVSALSFLRRSERHRDRLRSVGRLPWEIAIIALAFLVLRRLQTGGAFIEGAVGGLRRPSPLLLLFPILFLAGFAVAGARLLPVVARWGRQRSGRRAPWAYLAVHRLAAAPRLVVLLIAASTLSLGIFVQAQTVVRSLETTVDAKARVFVGSDVQGRVGFDTPQPGSYAMPTTRVTRRLLAGSLEPAGGPFDLMTIDLATFSEAAYWNDAFASEDLDVMLSRLAEHRGAGVPVAVAGDDVDPTALFVDREHVQVDVVAHADAFPGMSSLRPLVVADEAAFLAAFGGANPLARAPASTQLWVRGEEDAARAALGALEFPPELVLTASEVEDIPSISAVVDTFLVLNALGLAAAALVVAAMLMYLQSRQRSQLVSYGLSLRMGMTHRAHRRSLVGEVSAMLCSSYAMAVVLALTAAFLTTRMLDPLESIPPAPLFASPVAAVAVSLVGVTIVGWLGGWFANRRARRVDFGEVMRVAE
ncbi:MAG: hypothetical protein ACRDHU_02700 [Actinomycetota bacterium]